jgi:hypothetical protein
MEIIQLDNYGLLNEVYLLRGAIKNEIKRVRKDVNEARKLAKIDKKNASVYNHSADEAERLWLNPLIQLYNKKIKNLKS